MKIKNILKYAACLLFAAAAAACSRAEFDEITDVNLGRCLEPLNLSAKVSNALGDVVTFAWDVTKDAESYDLTVYTDKSLSSVYMSQTLEPSQVPYTVKLTADQDYYFTVQAKAAGKQDSHVASYTKAISTFAVKDNLFLKVTDRSANSITLSWSTEVSDFEEVDRVLVSTPGSDSHAEHSLSASEISAGSAVIDGLSAGTEYEFVLKYLSASRGQVNAWTTPDVNGYTDVNSLSGLQNALLTSGARIHLMMEGSPYDIEAMDISAGVSIVGEEDVDGNKPVIKGEFHITDSYDGGDLYFESLEFNGGPTADSPSGFGFAIQKKNGGTAENLKIGNISYKNCVITGYSKGLIYEWSKSFNAGDIIYDSCDINNINSDGTGGGDVFDIRQASSMTSVQFVNNTIYQGMRTFVRFDQATVGKLVFENNTLQNLNFVDNTNNAGIFGINAASSIGSFSFKNNLFLNMTGKAVLAGSNAKYAPASDLGVAASGNYFYNLPVGDDGALSYFTDNFTQANANGTILDTDPCYNAPGGYFNILADSEIAGKNIGASKWWTPYVEEPEDLTLGLVEGSKTWNLGNAKYFSGTIKKEMVRDLLYIGGSENMPIIVSNSMLNFQDAVVTNKAGVPVMNYIAFKVDKPGSVVIKASDADMLGNHLVVGVGPVDGSEIALKGGVSAMSDMSNATKILITTITEESIVYIYPSGPVSLEKLAWSNDVSPVNTALPAPKPVAEPGSITAGDATDIVVSWEPVDNAGSYSVVFSGKTSTVSDGTEFVIGGTTTGMLDAGSYTVEVYANPGASDIYNTESEAGTAAFAVLPKGGSGGDDALVVNNIDGLLAAIAAGKSAVTLAAGEYDLGGQMTVTAPLQLTGQDGTVMDGAFKLSGEVGVFSLKNISFNAAGQGNFIEFDGSEGLVAEEITIENCVIDGYGKSVIYASNSADKFNLGDISFKGVEVYNHGTGQGMFDLRNGVYGSFSLLESTLTRGRDFLRIDATCTIASVLVKNNTMYNLNTNKNGNGIFFVRAAAGSYRVEKNLLLGMTSGTVIGKSGAKVPKMTGNYYYDCNDDVFFSGIMDKEEALGGQGAVLGVNPVKDAAGGDFTLVNAVVMSAGVGAPKWNPSAAVIPEGGAITVNNESGFQAAIDAGKTNIRFAAGNYDLSAADITLTAGMRLSGESGANVTISQLQLGEGELGTIAIEGIDFTVTGGNFINVGTAPDVNSLIVRNCTVSGVAKSVYYGNGDGTFQSVVFSGLVCKDLGGGQGTFDIRKGSYNNFTIEQSTIIGGRDFLRADAGKVTGAVNVINNTFDSCTLSNNNGILYVRSTPESYVVRNNLFLNENGGNCKLSSANAAVQVPSYSANNYFYNCTADAFWTGNITQETALANGGVILASDPVKDAANGDYTLVDALCLSSNVGASRWNPNAGKVSSEITVSNAIELVNAIDAGKTAVTLKAGTYDLRELVDGGVITLIAPLSLEGKGTVEIIGGFKFGAGTSSFSAENISFNGVEKALGNTFEIAEAVEMSSISIVGCDIRGYNKSLFYGNGGDSRIGVFNFQKSLVHGFGTGQGMIDIRKGSYTAINVSKNTFYDGGRDFIRCDKDIAGSIAITNNTFGACSIDAGNGLLWVRSCAADPSRYNVSKNLFLNMTGSTILAKSGATVPAMSSNYFFNLGDKFFGGAIDRETATTGGAVLEADPCAGSADFNFKLTDAALKAADIGDPRWNSSSPNYTKKK